MATEFTHQPTFTIIVDRCYDCRRFYGYEKHAPYPLCPHCVRASMTEVRSEIETLKRSNASLRGALKRSKP